MASRPAPRARRAEERKRPGSTAAPAAATARQASPAVRHRDDQAANVTTARLAQHRSIVIPSGAFVCKINSGQQLAKG